MNYTYGTHMRNGDWHLPLDAALVERFVAADCAMVNLETSVSRRGHAQDKQYTFRAAPEDLAYLVEHLGVDVVTLANNHTLDYGEDAFLDTLEHVAEWGLAQVGGGRNLEEAMQPYILETQGRRLAIFGASQAAPTHAWYAKENRPGHLIAYNTKLINEAIAKAKETCDFVMVYLHWGDELEEYPESLQTRAARSMIDAGADAIIGAHPHIIQTFEIYKDKPIAYSLGNFLFNNKSGTTAAAFLHFTDTDIQLEIVPCSYRSGSTIRTDEAQTASLWKSWAKRSGWVRFDEQGILRPDPDNRLAPRPTPTSTPLPEPSENVLPPADDPEPSETPSTPGAG